MNLSVKLLVPLAAVAVALLVGLDGFLIPSILGEPLDAFQGASDSGDWGAARNQLFLATAIGFVGMLAAFAVASEWVVRRPLARLFDAIRGLVWRDSDGALPLDGKGELNRLAMGVAALGEILERRERDLSLEARRREQAEEALRESQERYALAVRCADDGLWEWDLKTGLVYFSPRWKSMLGFADAEIGDGIDEWRNRIHPEDRASALDALDAHLAGNTPRFENEHRLRHRDGSYRWVLARGTAIRSASGRPNRVVGLNTDISGRKQVQEALLELAEGLSEVQGEQCFQLLVKNFASVLGVREAFVCECVNYPTTRVRMLAHWNLGKLTDCAEFDLAGTSCEDVIVEGRTCYYPKDVGERFPLEKLYDRDSYLGIPVFDSTGKVIGHIACMDGGPMREELPHQAIFKIFAVRAAIEMERRLLERERHRVGPGRYAGSRG